MARKQPEVTAETRQNIIDAYWQLIMSDTVNKITVKMIAERAGYNRGTFYSYFLDIEDLQSQIEDELLPSEESFEKLREATISKNSKEILDVFMQIEDSVGIKLSFLLGPSGSLSFQCKFKESLKSLIIKYLPLDLNVDDKTIDYKTEMLCGLFYETLNYWYRNGNKVFKNEEMISLMMDTIFYGVVGSKFHKENWEELHGNNK